MILVLGFKHNLRGHKRAIDQIIDLQFRILSLESAEEHLVRNFPNLECIHLGTALQTNVISGLGADIFAGLERLVQLNLNYLGVESMAENSLRFSTRRHLKVDLSHNWVTAYELKRSNISVDNTNGSVDVDLRYNKVKALPYYVFADYCRPDYKVRINLLYNPIKCRYNDVKWVYEDRETVADHLYNVYCVNYNNRDLLKRRTTGIPVPNFYHNSSQCYKISGSYITPDPYSDSYGKYSEFNASSDDSNSTVDTNYKISLKETIKR
ncbi:unnamed protein product [Medioppia subpectinata]|uniref:Uncharacterized protein n=1 Tax=Medioppia subpectinata TaxID=1979941 RepID=A0A7R9KP74_9ACAR|nr:unnamed protein product [Medioppia subpectinata]CAG2105836.1 unnamed protein product [Medioppia subpectinata]